MEDKLDKKFKKIVQTIEKFSNNNAEIADVEKGILTCVISLGKDLLEHYIEEKNAQIKISPGPLLDNKKKRWNIRDNRHGITEVFLVK